MKIRFSLLLIALFVFAACQQETSLQDMISENALQEAEGNDQIEAVSPCQLFVDAVETQCGPSCIGEGRRQQCYAFKLPQVCIDLHDGTAACNGNLIYKIYQQGNLAPDFVFNSTSDAPCFVLPPSAFGKTYYVVVCDGAGGSSSQYYFTMPTQQDCNFDSPL